MTKLLSPILILFLFLFASCGAPLYVSVPVEYTPHSYFRKDTTTIVVINRFDADALKIGNKKSSPFLKRELLQPSNRPRCNWGNYST